MLKVIFNMVGCTPHKPPEKHSVIVCHCHQVTDRDIKSAIDRGAGSLEAISATCGAGSGCGGCTSEIAALLFRTRKVLPMVTNLMADELEVAS